MYTETLDYFMDDKKEKKIEEIRSLIQIYIYWNGKNAFTLTWPGGEKVYNGSKEGFAKFLRKLQAKESGSYPRSARFKTYAEIVDCVCSGRDPNVYVWSNILASIPERIINEEVKVSNKESLEENVIVMPNKLKEEEINNYNGILYVYKRSEGKYQVEDKRTQEKWDFDEEDTADNFAYERALKKGYIQENANRRYVVRTMGD